jgi:predicted secreted protein
MHPLRWFLVLLTFAAFSSTMLQAAESPLTYDRISLEASAEGKAGNDIQVAVLFSRSEGPAAGPLAADVNKAISAALELAKKVPEVTVQTLDYQTLPTYQNQKVTGWSVQQSIRLESKNTQQLGHLIGDLQKTLKVESITYQVAPETLRSTEDRLMGEALKAFQQRAELVTRALGRNRYRVVALEVNTGGATPPPWRPAARAMAMEATAAPPAIEAGEQTVTVTVKGVIELQND